MNVPRILNVSCVFPSRKYGYYDVILSGMDAQYQITVYGPHRPYPNARLIANTTVCGQLNHIRVLPYVEVKKLDIPADEVRIISALRPKVHARIA